MLCYIQICQKLSTAYHISLLLNYTPTVLICHHFDMPFYENRFQANAHVGHAKYIGKLLVFSKSKHLVKIVS